MFLVLSDILNIIFKMGIILFFILGAIIGFIVAGLVYKNKISPSQLQKIEPSTQGKLFLEEKIWYKEEVEFIFSLNERLSLTLNKDKVAECVTEAVHNFLCVQKAVLLLLHKDTEELKVDYAIGVEQDSIKELSFNRGQSISGFIISKREPLIINDLEGEHYLKKINKEGYLQKSFVSTPLIFQNDVLGVLHVCDKKSGALFTKRDVAFLINVGRISAIALQNAQLHEQMQDDYLKTITALALTVDARDSYTRRHSENVTRYSVAIAKEMGCSGYEIEALRRAAILHDIGKIGIRDNILLKADNTTQEEFEQIKLHSIKGEDIVKSLSFLKEPSLLIRHHHERYDGLGYPDGIKAYDIELGSRILAVADTFDAMTTDRLYHKALSLNEATKELELNKGTQFDPLVVECFLKILNHDPSVVKSS